MNKKQTLAIAAILVITALAAGAITLRGSADSGHGQEEVHAGHKDGDEKHGNGNGNGDGDGDGHDHDEAGKEKKDAHEHDDGDGDGDHRADAERIAFSDDQIRAAGIDLAEAAVSDMAAMVPLPGEIRFDADRTAHVVPRVAGVVETAPARLGQTVKKGQLLATISSGAVSDLRSDAHNARERLALARDNYIREQSLWQDKISAAQDYLAARAALREAEIAARNANQKLAAIGAPEGGNGAHFAIRAPFDGVVVEKHIAQGEMVKEDTAIFTLSDLRQVWADIDVPASALDAVRVGASAVVHNASTATSASTAKATEATGRVAYVGALLGEQSRTAKAHVVLPNPGGAWRPGLVVTVEVASGPATPTLSVPDEAVHTLEGRTVVFVRDGDGFTAQAVKTGRSQNGRTEIVSGLSAGQRYAARNAFMVKAEMGKAGAEHAH